MESAIDSVIGVTGAIYAIRRKLFEKLPKNTILDDVLIPMRIADRGFRIVFEDGAKAYDHANSNPNVEFKRKVRTLTGNYQILYLYPRLLWIGSRLFLQYFSHKIMRLLGPFLFLVVLFSNFLILDEKYFAILMMQCLWYIVVFFGRFLSVHNIKKRYISWPYVFMLINYAAALGFWNVVTNKDDVWEH